MLASYFHNFKTLLLFIQINGFKPYFLRGWIVNVYYSFYSKYHLHLIQSLQDAQERTIWTIDVGAQEQ